MYCACTPRRRRQAQPFRQGKRHSIAAVMAFGARVWQPHKGRTPRNTKKRRKPDSALWLEKLVRVTHMFTRTHCAAAKGRPWSVTFIAGLGSHSRTLRKQRGRRLSARRERDEKSCSSSTWRQTRSCHQRCHQSRSQSHGQRSKGRASASEDHHRITTGRSAVELRTWLGQCS
jgi:hypothetical protein